MRDHLCHAGFPEFTLVASELVFCFAHRGVKVEGVPGDFEFCVWVGFLVLCHGEFETTFADKAPGADLQIRFEVQGGSTVSEMMSILISRAICVE